MWTATLALSTAAIAAGAKSLSLAVALPNALVADDRLTLKAGKLTDTSDNKNARVSQAAIKAQASPRVISVLMSNPLHSAQTRWEVPDEFFAENTPGTNEITIAAKADGAGGDDASSGIGRTQFAVEVRFSGYIRSVTSGNHTALVADLLAATAGRSRNQAANETLAAAITRVRGLMQLPATSSNANRINAPAELTGPTTMVRYQAQVADAALLPMARDLVDVEAGIAAAAAITGPPAFPAITGVDEVATGYAKDTRVTGQTDDDARDKVDEDKNGASQRRITVSGSVKPYVPTD